MATVSKYVEVKGESSNLAYDHVRCFYQQDSLSSLHEALKLAGYFFAMGGGADMSYSVIHSQSLTSARFMWFFVVSGVSLTASACIWRKYRTYPVEIHQKIASEEDPQIRKIFLFVFSQEDFFALNSRLTGSQPSFGFETKKPLALTVNHSKKSTHFYESFGGSECIEFFQRISWFVFSGGLFYLAENFFDDHTTTQEVDIAIVSVCWVISIIGLCALKKRYEPASLTLQDPRKNRRGTV